MRKKYPKIGQPLKVSSQSSHSSLGFIPVPVFDPSMQQSMHISLFSRD